MALNNVNVDVTQRPHLTYIKNIISNLINTEKYTKFMINAENYIDFIFNIKTSLIV